MNNKSNLKWLYKIKLKKMNLKHNW